MKEGISLLICKVRKIIVDHPLIAFIVFAYGISWISWVPIKFLDAGIAKGFSVIGVAGPALAGMIVSAILHPEKSPSVRKRRLFTPLVLFLVVVSILIVQKVWNSVDLLNIHRGAVVSQDIMWLAVLTDVIAAGVITVVLSGFQSTNQGAKCFLASLNPLFQRIHWLWYVMGIFLYPAIVMIGNLIAQLLDFPASHFPITGQWQLVTIDIVLFFLGVLVGGGGLEEPGWRGMALPLLEKRFSPIISVLLLSVIWAFWHWPLYWLGYSEGGLLGVVLYIVGVLPLSIILSSIYHWSKGSLLVVMLLHTSINITSVYITPSAIASALWLFLSFILAILIWRKPGMFKIYLHQFSQGGS